MKRLWTTGVLSALAGAALMAHPAAGDDLDLQFDRSGEGWKNLDGTYWKLSPRACWGSGAVSRIFYKGTKAGMATSLVADRSFPFRGSEIQIAAACKGNPDVVSAEIVLNCIDALDREVGTCKFPMRIKADYVETTGVLKLPADTSRIYPSLQVAVKADCDEMEYFYCDIKEMVTPHAAETAPVAGKKIPVKSVPWKSSYHFVDPASGPVTKGNLSIGKFYRYSIKPDSNLLMFDQYEGIFTDGAKLTDGEKHGDVHFRHDLSVGWKDQKEVDVVVDLGTAQTMERAVISGFYGAEENFKLPEDIRIFSADSEKGPWKPAGSWAESGRGKFKPAGSSCPFSVEIPLKAVAARFVKFTFACEEKGSLVLDELTINGKIRNSRKYVPVKECYHGAFTPSYSVPEKDRLKEDSNMALAHYEKMVGKKLAMVLWYQGISPERDFREVQAFRSRDLAARRDGQRFMLLGWLPKKTVSLQDILSGKLDDYITQYFRDSMDPEVTGGDETPFWFRPMNEFNSHWVSWGLDPVRFRKAWRRLYNIAEQVGAARRHVFVWSPNHRSYPDVEWNRMENYYPGDQYVDWVGLSCYPPSPQYAATEDARYPLGRCEEVWRKYGKIKPMMVAEGGYETPDKVDRMRWVKEWFEVPKVYPGFKAMIWENHNARVLQNSGEPLELYRKLVKSPLWLE